MGPPPGLPQMDTHPHYAGDLSRTQGVRALRELWLMSILGSFRTANLSSKGNDTHASLNMREPPSQSALNLPMLNLTALGWYLHNMHRCALLA